MAGGRCGGTRGQLVRGADALIVDLEDFRPPSRRAGASSDLPQSTRLSAVSGWAFEGDLVVPPLSPAMSSGRLVKGANAMSRKSPSPVEPVAVAEVRDLTLPLDLWFERQREWTEAGFDQMVQSQQMLLQAWLQLVETWWAPLTPFVERGAEQLA